MKLYNAIKMLCPDMGQKEIRRAIQILEGAPLIPHGKLQKANYGLNLVREGDGRYDALFKISFCMLMRCFEDDYAAVASTQVGITFPIIVFAGSETCIQHPKCRKLRSKPIALPEGCGSLLNKAVYFASYPGRVSITFYQLEGERECYKNLAVGSWFKSTQVGSANGVDVNDYIHELRHLQGHTAASNGWLLHPKNVPGYIWAECFENFVGRLKPGYRDEVLKILRRFRSGNSNLELRGKRAFWAYLHVWKAKMPDARLLLPTAWYDPRPYRVVSTTDYAKEIERIF